MSKTLNIFNGDCLAGDWQKHGFTGDVLIWRENYLPGFGEFDLSLDCHSWCQRRAEFLVTTAPDLDVKSIQEYLIYMEDSLRSENLKKYDLIYLFFDRCIYDFGLLMRIFWKLSQIPAGQLPIIKLILDDDLIRETPEYWQRKIDESQIIGSDDLILTAQLYQSYVAGRESFAAAAEKITLSWHDCYEYNCERLLGEMPPPGELTQTERNILDILQSGSATPIEIFQKLDKYEKQLFLGDSSCWNILNGLAAQKLIKMEIDGKPTELDGLSFAQLKAVTINKL